MFVIIWGSRSIALTIGAGTFICPRCRLPRQFRHKLVKRFFTLYYIPIFPIRDQVAYVECVHCKAQLRTEVLGVPDFQVKYQARHPLRLPYMLLGAIFAVLFLCIVVASARSAQEAQQAAIARANAKATTVASFGVATFEGCKSVVKTAKSILPANAHLLIVNKNTEEVWSEYQQPLSSDLKAISEQDLTHVICLVPDVKQYDQDAYAKKDSDVPAYTCTRYQRTLEAFVVDVKSGQTVAYQKFWGSIPPQCPDKTNRNLSYYGENPTPASLIRGLKFESLPAA